MDQKINLVADLHLHSKYSRAVSPKMDLPIMAQMARIKGIDLLATGDFTHPLWIKELDSQLEEITEGIYTVKQGRKVDSLVRYILGTEISCIFTQGGKGRRIHILVYAPSLSVVHKINQAMKKAGCNLMSDGRPIIGLSLIQLCELLFNIDENIMVVPAHVWTPWFGLFGSKSGFDSLTEAFGKFADKIYAVETGLSSDPIMNWRIKELENRAIVSFSDAHSPAKLGRELTVFKTKNTNQKSINFTYIDFINCLKQEGNWEVAVTVEFYPQEGKYHYSGHRNCQVVQNPEETKKRGATCHVCGRALTVGVMHRVEQLAAREIRNNDLKIGKNSLGIKIIGYKKRPVYMMLVPLLEIIAEVLAVGVASKRVNHEYDRLIGIFGSELNILTKISLKKIAEIGGKRLKEAIEKVRTGDIFIDPGYDGVFGKVKIWGEKSKNNHQTKQEVLF